jgi:hypothetical protein
MKNKYITVEFTRELTLPRFTVKKGGTWKLRAERLSDEGFTLGGGFVYTTDFKLKDA